MSVLVVGMSHRSAPLHLVERVAVAAAELPKVLLDLRSREHVAEVCVLSTCNRVEVYTHVARFHGGVDEVSAFLADRAGLPLEAISEHLYVHYEDRAVQHLFSVASGLESMVVGEGQVQGQVREAFGVAQDEGVIGRVLGELFRHALRVGKRTRTETGIGRTGASLVSVGLELAERSLGSLVGRSVVVVGAGAMGALAGESLRAAGVGRITVANRTEETARVLASRLGGEGVGLDGLVAAIAQADLVVSSTGAAGSVVTHAHVAEAVAARGADQPLLFLDLALPRDIDPAVRELPGVDVADLEALRVSLEADPERGADIEAVRAIVAEEGAVFLAWQRATEVAPTVVALRAKAEETVAAEVTRLRARVPDLNDKQRTEVEDAIRRVAEKLLHAPSVRVKELAGEPGGHAYADALRELFGLDQQVAAAVAVADLPDANAGAANAAVSDGAGA